MEYGLEAADEELIANTTEVVKVKVAVDSGSVANVIFPEGLPRDVVVSGNENGHHFTGAGGDPIRRHGSCKTRLKGARGEVGCGWQVADVTRALHSCSTICGPEEHPTGLQDVLFNNKRCVIVPPGVVERILREVRPVAEYLREGGLYTAEMELSSFPRQGLAQ